MPVGFINNLGSESVAEKNDLERLGNLDTTALRAGLSELTVQMKSFGTILSKNTALMENWSKTIPSGEKDTSSPFEQIISAIDQFNSISDAIKNFKDIKDSFGNAAKKGKDATKSSGTGLSSLGTNIKSAAKGSATACLCCPCKSSGITAARPTGAESSSPFKGIGNTADQKAMELFHKTLEKIEGTTKKAGTSLASFGKNIGSAALQMGIMTLELGKQALAWTVSTAKIVAHKIATTAACIAQKAMAVAQAVLNFLMSTNPIGIIIVAIGALTVGLVLLFNNCKPFHNWVVNAVNVLVGFFTKTIPNAWNTVLNSTSTIWKSITVGISNAWNNITSGITNAWNNITKIFNNPSLLLDAIREGFSSAIKWVLDLPNQALNWGKDIIMGIVNGIKGAVSSVRDAVSGVAEDIRKFLHFSTPDEGPLADFDTYMPDMMGSLARGMKDNLGKVRSAAWEVASAMSIPLQPVTFGVTQQISTASIQTAQQSSSSQLAVPSTMANIVLNLNGYEVGRILTPIMSQTLEVSARQKSFATGG